MVKREIILICLGMGLLASTLSAQPAKETQALFSPVTAELFGSLGTELVFGEGNTSEIGMTFLQGGILLDEESGAGYEAFLRGIGSGLIRQNYSDTTLAALRRYVDQKADLEIASKAIAYLLNQSDSRSQREIFLNQLLPQAASANPVFASDMVAQLGLYAVEKADYAGAVKQFEYACQLNPYNMLAQSRLIELQTPQTANAAVIEKLSWMRLQLLVNPCDLPAAKKLGQETYRAGLFDLSADFFAYAAGLSEYLHPGALLDDEIAFGWIQSCYRSVTRRADCAVIADKMRQGGRIHLAIETIAALAAEEMGKPEDKSRILMNAAERGEKSIDSARTEIKSADLGWFYCIALENPEKALAWCNKALKESGDDETKALLAYAFLLNQQADAAKQYAEPLLQKEPIAMLVMARLAIQQDQKQQAADLLKKALGMDLALPVEMKAKALLSQAGGDYIPEVAPELVQNALADRFGKGIISDFVSPKKMVAAKLVFNGEDFMYGTSLDARLVIENNGKTPLILCKEGLLTGTYRVDAVLRGDVNRTIPRLVEGVFRPGRAILPGESITVRIDVNSGVLSKCLFMYPQASVDIVFSVYLDPKEDVNGQVSNALSDFPVIHKQVHRKKVELTREYIVQRLDTLSKGQEGQKIRVAELFAGLYAEQLASKSGQVPYRFIAIDSALLVDSVRKILMDDSWKVRVQAMAMLCRYSVPLDYAMTASVSDSLNHNQWPVRMISIWLLGSQQKDTFRQVLDWKAQYDPFWLNRQLSVVLGGKSAPLPQAEPELDKKP